MNEESREQAPDTSQGAEAPEVERSLEEYRSVDAVLQAAKAVGELTGGLGTLAIGVSQLKKTFGGGDESSEPPSPASDAPAQPAEPKSGD
jgi:X-X-X-Leu-X-X-Gly heptad repeat protein